MRVTPSLPLQVQYREQEQFAVGSSQFAVKATPSLRLQVQYREP